MKIQRKAPASPAYIPRYAMTARRSPLTGQIVTRDGKPVMKKFWPGRTQSKYDPQACDKNRGFRQ